ncbi:hypothetical protein PybrP1_010672 [[Pythium] brassicae (nom. inval.)]|nr:hypothetical protein PybrP1_010672 [[Pythium] brassicae (nom. inval.)]
MKLMNVVVATLAAVMCVPTRGEARKQCRGAQQLRDLLLLGHDSNANTAAEATSALLDECVRPLLLLPFKWTSAGADAHAYCAQDACVRAVARLRALPPCTWEQLAHAGDDVERELLVAQRVMADCGAQ